MIRTCIVNTDTGVVENVVEYESLPEGVPPGMDGPLVAVASDTAGPDWTWDGSSFIAPEIPMDIRPPSFLARDFFALLSVSDFVAIRNAVASNDALGLLWASLQAQGEAPISSTAERFLAGWGGLKQALPADRVNAIATALGIPNS
jgi:hypothetical protein